MNQKKRQYWSTVHDDDLELVEKMADFLQDEFCLKGTDKMWSSEYFRWKLSSSNPAGRGYVSLAVEEGQVVGSISITKKRLLINGYECIGAEIGDSYTAASIRRRGKPLDISSVDSDPKAYKNKSIFGRLASEVRSRAELDGVSIIYGTPNKFSYPGYIKHLDYVELDKYVNKSYFRPTSKLLIKQYPVFKYFYIFFRALEIISIKVPLFIYDMLVARNIKFDNVIPTSNELNDFWIKNKPSKGFSLVRDGKYWKHRYRDHPLAEYEYFSARKNGKLIGLYVTRKFSSGEHKSSVSVVEWMAEDGVKFNHAILKILDYYKKSEVDFFHLWAQESSKEAKSAIMSLFLLRRTAPIILANTQFAQNVKNLAKDFKFYLGSSDAI